MILPPRWRRPYVGHAVRVAIVATAIIGAMYVCVVAGFNIVERDHLVGQIDTRLHERLTHAAEQPQNAGSIVDYDNDHDVDDSPVFLWRVTDSGRVTALTPSAPTLARSEWPPLSQSADAQLGSQAFRLQVKRIDGGWFVAAQSLSDAERVQSDLLALEFIAGPILLLAVFFGTLLIGLKAAAPVELARRRQLEFTADASHELRTPLSVIEAEVTLSLKSGRSEDDYRATLASIGLESLRLRRIVEDLLWLARFDSEPPPPGHEPVDVAAVTAACADRFAAVAERDGITLLVRDESGSPPWINAPPAWIDRLVAVLVDNACRYAGPGGIVRLMVSVTGNRVCLRVDDSGPGIPPEERPRLFDRFHRATEVGGGSGLGLAIGDSVVRATGGEWRIDQSNLGGTRMEVSWRRSPGAKVPEHPKGPSSTSLPKGASPDIVVTG
jgi:signal transduction histidine kinase